MLIKKKRVIKKNNGLEQRPDLRLGFKRKLPLKRKRKPILGPNERLYFKRKKHQRSFLLKKVSLRLLVSANFHEGGLTKKELRHIFPYFVGERRGYGVFNLNLVVITLRRVLIMITIICRAKKRIIINTVGTLKKLVRPVVNTIARGGKNTYLYSKNKWVGGCISNFRHIIKSIYFGERTMRKIRTLRQRNFRKSSRGLLCKKVPQIPHLFISLTDHHWSLNEAKAMRLRTIQCIDSYYPNFFADMNLFLGISTVGTLLLYKLIKESIATAIIKKRRSFVKTRRRMRDFMRRKNNQSRFKLLKKCFPLFKKKVKLFRRKFKILLQRVKSAKKSIKFPKKSVKSVKKSIKLSKKPIRLTKKSGKINLKAKLHRKKIIIVKPKAKFPEHIINQLKKVKLRYGPKPIKLFPYIKRKGTQRKITTLHYHFIKEFYKLNKKNVPYNLQKVIKNVKQREKNQYAKSRI